MKYLAIFFLFTIGQFHSPVFGLAPTSLPVTLSLFGGNFAPEIAVNPTGDALAVWVQNFPNRVQTAYFDVLTLTWSPFITLGFGTFPQVDINSTGDGLAVWVDSTTNQIVGSRFDFATKTWSAPVQISLTGINSLPQVSINTTGHGIAAWVQTIPPLVFAASFDTTTMTWSLPLSLSGNSGGFPQTGLDDFNRATVIWENFSQGSINAIQLLVP